MTPTDKARAGMNDAHIADGFNRPPFSVESFPESGWHCVVNANGFNVLRFKSQPGCVFTLDKGRAETLAKEWNERR